MSRLEPFYPPRRSPLLVRFIMALHGLIMRMIWGLTAVEISEDEMERLRRIRHTGAMVISNHPSLAEPAVIFVLLGRAGVSYHSLVAWDTMALHGTIWRRFLQAVGGYSILRARRDRASMQMTQKLLEQGERIAIFPEGQTYGLNDILIPFQQGVAQMGFWALEDMEKHRLDRPLLIVPLAIKYLWTRPMEGEIRASLGRLESALGLVREDADYFGRLIRIAAAVLSRMEKDQGLQAEPGDRLDDRIDRLREAMVYRLAERLIVELPREVSFPMAVQLLGNAYDEAVSPVRPDSTVEQRLERERKATAVKPLQAQWLRLKNFLAVREGYVQANPTVERFLDILGRLEVEVLGKSRISGPRKAVVRCGEPINLWDHLEQYRQSKRETVAQVTTDLQERVAAMLAELGERAGPLAHIS